MVLGLRSRTNSPTWGHTGTPPGVRNGFPDSYDRVFASTLSPVFERLKSWLREPVQQHDETDWEAFGRTFGPKVGSAREPRSRETSAVRRWNQADTTVGEEPRPRWRYVVTFTVAGVVFILTMIAIFWWGSTIPMPDR